MPPKKKVAPKPPAKKPGAKPGKSLPPWLEPKKKK